MIELSNGCVKNEGFPRFGKVILFVDGGKIDKSNLPDFLGEDVSIQDDKSIKGSESGLVLMRGGSDVSVRVNLINEERSSIEDEDGKHDLPDISLRGDIREIRIRKGYSTDVYSEKNGKSINVSVIDEEEYNEKALGIRPPQY